MERIYRTRNVPLPAWVPHEYILTAADSADDLPLDGVPAGSQAYRVSPYEMYLFNGASWEEAKPSPEQVAAAVNAWLDAHPEATTTVQDGSITRQKLHESLLGAADIGDLARRVTSLDDTPLFALAFETRREPRYISDPSLYSEWGLTEKGWYVFARITARAGTVVTAETEVTGAAGHKKTIGQDHVDVAVRFDVAALSQAVTVSWGDYTETAVFRSTDLGIRNLDYRTTFYVYDVAQFTTWAYALTTDTEFAEGKHYYTKDGDTYTEATVTAGDAVPADTYYNHSKVTFSGMARNITYVCTTEIDCPMEFVLPEIEDDTHGCWFEIRCMHADEYSMTLLPPEGVKIATEHTQKETKGLNDIVLHYNSINGVKLWRFLNTHSSIPA